MASPAQKAKNYLQLYRIWKEHPKSTFQQVRDMFSKAPILRSAYLTANDMLSRDKLMFYEACTALLSGELFRTHGKKEKSIIDIIRAEDTKVNELAREVRKKILEYLAKNTAPDVKSSLTLTTLVIDLERLGDYTKDIAKLTLMHPTKFQKKNYVAELETYKNQIINMFDLTRDAFLNQDREKAELVIKLNTDLKRGVDKFFDKIDRNSNKFSVREAIAYTLFSRLFKRVGSHLENLATSAVTSFTYLGFKTSLVRKDPDE